MAETTESDSKSNGADALDHPPEPPSDQAVTGPSAAADERDTNPDPHHLGPFVAQLSDEAAEDGRGALAVLSVLLREGERVQDLAVGRLNGANGVIVLTNERVVLANDRPHKADALEFPLAAGLEVRGWQDGDRATIAVLDESDSATIDEIIDRASAHRLAAGVEEALTELG